MDPQSSFQGYAIIEVMGHSIEIGFVTTEYFGGPALFRVDRPQVVEREYALTKPQWIGDTFCGIGSIVKRESMPGKTIYLGPSAIFRMTPCDGPTAMAAIDQHMPAPIKVLTLVEAKRISARIRDDDEGLGSDGDD